MPEKSAVFEKHYEGYLEQIAEIDLATSARILGLAVGAGAVTVPYLGQPYTLSANGIAGPDGRRPHYGTCVILCKYLLLCPDDPVTGGEWQSYKDFKDAAPLTTYFSSNVERRITTHFTGRLQDLQQAAAQLGGQPPAIDDLPYDYCVEFQPLPRITCLLAFNDADEEFPADCRILFQNTAAAYLDMECVAMIGSELAEKLVMAVPS